MINLIANKELKDLGCKWNGIEWIAPKLAENETQEIKDYFYSDLITIEVMRTGDCGDLRRETFGNASAVSIGGYVVATAWSKDSGAKISEGVAVLEGGFGSGGSNYKFYCRTKSGALKLRMQVSRKALLMLDEEVKVNRYSYRIIEEKPSCEVLLSKRQSLLEQIKLIDEQLEAIKDNK